jgi:phosphopantothenoylcysteine decarboxylase
VLLGVSGSVAAVKAPLLAEHLLRFADVRVVVTSAARHFLPPNAPPYAPQQGVGGSTAAAAAADAAAASRPPPPPPPEDEGEEQQNPDEQALPLSRAFPRAARPVLGDDDEWRQWRRVGDPVAHIDLRRWADALVVAPLSANTLAKMASGMCDNLLTCVVRAWDTGSGGAGEDGGGVEEGEGGGGKPLLVAPAMNTAMWQSPFTRRHLAVLEDVLRAEVVQPVSKRLACGDVGAGAMAEPADVARRVAAVLASRGFACEGGG